MSKANKYLVMLGVGDDRKARAARFDLAEEAAVRKAAGLMNFRVGIAKGDTACAAASKLPEGKLFESGLGMVPLISEDKFYLLFKLLSFDTAWNSAGIISSRPQVTDVVTLEAAEKLWGGIKIGSVVLAWDGSDPQAFGWSACIVVSIAKSGQMIEIRFRDWPGIKPWQVSQRSVALLPPDFCP
jgi:hypothetical protein